MDDDCIVGVPAGVAEAVLATPVDRVRWLSAYVAMGLIAAVLTIAAGVVGALVGAARGRDPRHGDPSR